MAITEDASTPVIVVGTSATSLTTASFSPPANSLLLAVVGVGWGNTVPTGATVTDSGGHTWTVAATAAGTVSGTGGLAKIAYTYLSSAPGSITVTATFTNLSGGSMLAVRVLTGAASSQAGAGSKTLVGVTNSTVGTVSITTTTTNSLVYGIGDDPERADTFAVNGATSMLTGTPSGTYLDATDAISLMGWKATSATGTPGATTLGGTWQSGTTSNISAFEVLPASAGTASATGAPGAGTAGNATVTTVSTAVAYVNSTSVTSAGTASLVVTVPTGGATGDLLLFCVANRWPQAWSIPSGLTLGLSSRNGPMVGTLYYRIVQAGDPSTYTFTQTNSIVCAAVCARYSNVDQVAPIRFWSSTQSDDFNVSTSVTFPTVQNVGSTDMNAVFVTAYSNVSNVTTPVLGTPATWSGRRSVIANVTGKSSIAAAVFDKPAATDTPSSTGFSGFYLAYNMCLAAAVAPTLALKRMAPTFQSASTASSTTSATSLVVSKPTGTVNGDLLVAVTAVSQAPNALTFTGTWTPLYQDTPGFDGFNAIDVSLKIWFRVASSEPTSYTVGTSSAGGLSAAILRYANADTVPIRMLSSVNSTTVLTTSPTPVAVLQQQSNDVVLNCYAFGTDTSVASATITPPSADWTTRANTVTTGTGFQCGLALTEKINASDFPTCTASVGSGWGVLSVVLLGTVGSPQSMMILPQAIRRASAY